MECMGFEINPQGVRFLKTKGLTKREVEIVSLLGSGKFKNKEVADKLFIAEKTVRTHMSNVYKKFGCHRRKFLEATLQHFYKGDS